jgi:hypothetical protein
MVLLAAPGMVLAFWWNLHRVTVGQQGPYLPWNAPATAWRPPLPASILDAVIIVAVGIYIAFALKLSVQPRDPRPSSMA